MPVPVLSNFDPFGMKPNVVGGQRLNLSQVNEYNDTRTRVVAAGSADILPGRMVMFDPAGDTDEGPLGSRLPRLGVKAVDGTFTAADLAGVAIYRTSAPVRGRVQRFDVVDDTMTNPFEPEDSLSTAVDNEWAVEYDDLLTVPAAGDQVFVDNVNAGEEGRLSASVGVAIPQTVMVFTGYVAEGYDGKAYAGVSFLQRLN
jgi:hypothetical protein